MGTEYKRKRTITVNCDCQDEIEVRILSHPCTPLQGSSVDIIEQSFILDLDKNCGECSIDCPLNKTVEYGETDLDMTENNELKVKCMKKLNIKKITAKKNNLQTQDQNHILETVDENEYRGSTTKINRYSYKNQDAAENHDSFNRTQTIENDRAFVNVGKNNSSTTLLDK